MSSAAARVLDLFLHTPKRGVTGVTESLIAPKSPIVTPVTPVTPQMQYVRSEGVTGVTAAPGEFDFEAEERAAIIECDGGAPRAWAEALARLDPNNPPADVPTRRWMRFIDDCGRFLDDGWAGRSMALRWGPLDLFGCDLSKPFARIDRAGLLWLLNGQKLLVLTANSAAIAKLSGGSLTYRRKPSEPGRVLAWELPHA